MNDAVPSDYETMIGIAHRLGYDVMPHEAAQVVEQRVRVWHAALVWLATHDRSGVAAAWRAQRVAAGALHKGKMPEEVLGEIDAT